MSEKTNRSSQGFHGAEGRLGGAFNSAMKSGTLDSSAVTDLLAGLQKQAQALATLADAVGELDDKLTAIKRKLLIP